MHAFARPLFQYYVHFCSSVVFIKALFMHSVNYFCLFLHDLVISSSISFSFCTILHDILVHFTNKSRTLPWKTMPYFLKTENTTSKTLSQISKSFAWESTL